MRFDEWFSERTLVKNHFMDRAIDRLREHGHTYEQEGNLWFRSTKFGDDKDRVLIRKNGAPTYFAVDVAYHLSKFERGASEIIDIFGADHHGYIPRICAAMAALGITRDKLTFLAIQFAILYRGDERVPMSTRSGSFVTLRELRKEVGNDAARFFYVMRKNEQHLDFDLDLAKSQSNENPVYYIQYAHARICSVLRQMTEKNYTWENKQGIANLSLLTTMHERTLIETLARYPELIVIAASNYEPHLLTQYLRELAQALHSYYNGHQFLVDDVHLRNARITLILATKQVLANGLVLLGVKAPEEM